MFMAYALLLQYAQTSASLHLNVSFWLQKKPEKTLTGSFLNIIVFIWTDPQLSIMIIYNSTWSILIQ